MIDERHEELASLYALDLLEGEERARFESELAHTPVLRNLAGELRRTSAALAYAASVTAPPRELKARVLASVPTHGTSQVVKSPTPRVFRSFLPWALAAGFVLGTAWLTQLYVAARSETELLRSRTALNEISLQSSQQQLEAERLIVRQQLAILEKQATSAEARLAEARSLVAERERQIAALTADFRSQVDLANLKITALASMLNNSPKALAIAVWDPIRQEGVLKVEKLPALLPHQDYQIWVVDPQYPDPVDGGVFTVNPATGEARLNFTAKQRVGTVNAFAVTLERKGGVPKAEGPFVLLGR